MIYLKNTQETQEIFIPRNKLHKEAYVTSKKTYEDGYREGVSAGKEMQKDQLLNLYVTENGQYEREDGWGTVTVDLEIPDCSDAYDEGYNQGQSEGYEQGQTDGYNQGYGEGQTNGYNQGKQDGYNQGYEEGQNSVECPVPNLINKDVTITNNGTTQIRAEEDGVDGYNLVSINVDVPSEGGSCNLGEVSTSLEVGNLNRWSKTAAQYGFDGMSEITIDGSKYQEWTKAYTLLQAYKTTEEINITENGTYRPNVGYDGFALKGYNVGWITDVIPTIDTDVEIWVKPYDGAPNIWQGFIGSQLSDDDNTTFQIRKVDGNSIFSFRFGEQTFDYGFEYERWYRLRMNRSGVWVNGEQVHSWDVQAFEENPNPLMINGIYNNGFNGDSYRMNYASYGYVYFHNTDILLVPFNSGLFIGNKNQITTRLLGNDYVIQNEIGYYSKGYNKVVVDIQNGGSGGSGGSGGGSCNLINPIVFSETEGNTINGESVYIPYFIYESNQYYLLQDMNMAECEDFKIQVTIRPTGYFGEPINIFGAENSDWDETTFGVRIYDGNFNFRMSGEEVSYPCEFHKWYEIEMGYNSSRRWVIVNGQTIMDMEHTSFNKPNQHFMIGAINSGGNAFRPFYGYICAAYIEKNGHQVWFLPKDDGRMDVYWNDRSYPNRNISSENNARYESDYRGADGMKSITWLGKKTICPSLDGFKFGHSTFEYFNNNIDFRDDYSHMFEDCQNLIEAPNIQGIKNAYNMFRGCLSLTSAPSYDTSETTDLSYMFYDCISLVSAPSYNTSKATKIKFMYGNCVKLERVGSVDCSSLSNAEIGVDTDDANIFGNQPYPHLTDFGGLLNLRRNVKLQYLIALNEQSVLNVFNGLYDFTANGETPNNNQGNITMSRFIEDLVNTHKHIAEAKGWRITFE